MSREAFEAWAKQHGIAFVLRSHGEATKSTVSRDALTALWQAAQADAYERIAQIFDRRAKQANTPARMMEAQDDAYAIRALAKEAA